MKQTGSLIALAGLVSMAHGHGFVTTPKARMPGSAMAAACGQQVEVNQQSDNYGNIQGELQVAKGQNDYSAEKCDIWLCKGYKFADNKANVQSYSGGEKVDFVVDIRAPHTGVANVSVVDTASNSVIGSALKSWDVYASTATGVKEDETNFSVTIPEGLENKCSTAGACLLQWYWYAESIDQTYQSCVDFTVGGSGSGSGSGSSASSPESSVSITASATAGNNIAQPTTLVTSARQTLTSAPAAATPSSIPEDGTADEQLNWVSSLVRALTKM